MREIDSWNNYGPVEGWVVKTKSLVGIVKGCEHPLPYLHYVPRLVGGAKYHVNPNYVCRLVPCTPSPCLKGLKAPLIDSRSIAFIDPVSATKELDKYCNGGVVCRTAASLVEELVSAGLDLVGVTGGLIYSPRQTRDIDIVVYDNPDKAYAVLRKLRRDGVTTPLDKIIDESWVSTDKSLHRLFADRRLLYGLYNDVPYSIRLVSCQKPIMCRRGIIRGMGRFTGILRWVKPYTTPAYYILETNDDKFLVYTLRLRYTELPNGFKVVIEGNIEEYCGLRIIVPDHGFIKLTSNGFIGGR